MDSAMKILMKNTITITLIIIIDSIVVVVVVVVDSDWKNNTNE